MTTFRFVEEGRWSGGGDGLLGLARYAAGRDPVLSGGADGAILIIPRNVPASPHRLRRPFVLAPQNAWPWAFGGVDRSEIRRVLGLRAGSEVLMRAAAAVLRISSAIPVLGRGARYSPVIHNVLDPGFERALASSHAVDASAAAGRIVSIGSCYSYRNFERLIAAHQLLKDGRELLICGPVGSRAVADRVGALALDSVGVTIRWGSLPREVCIAYFRAADTVVLPSLTEASPFSALEALAVNSNVVLSDIVGHREILQAVDGEAPAIFANPCDSVELAHLLTDRKASAPQQHALLADAGFRESQRESWADRVTTWLSSVSLEPRS